MLTAVMLAVALVAPWLGLDGDANLHVPELAYGESGLAVSVLNKSLRDAGFNADDADEFGAETRHAVYAFQKHHGLETDGIFTAAMWELLDEPIELPQQEYADRVEVDLGKQVLYVLEDHEVVYVAPIASGNGELYNTSRGMRAYAATPEGEFFIERNINGVRKSFLGTLYDPYYFRGGFAFHGSKSVPNYPASHGCVRLTMWDSKKLKDYFSIGQPVYIYGDRTPVLDEFVPRPAVPLFE